MSERLEAMGQRFSYDARFPRTLANGLFNCNRMARAERITVRKEMGMRFARIDASSLNVTENYQSKILASIRWNKTVVVAKSQCLATFAQSEQKGNMAINRRT